jgi:lipoteichoic acid synthase
MNYFRRFQYDGLVLLQCSILFLKSVVFLSWVRKMAAKNEPLGFVQTLHAFPLHLPLYLALLSLVFLTKRKWVTALILNTVLSLLIFIDLIYFRAFGLPTSLFSLSSLVGIGEVGNTITGLIHAVDLLLFADVLLSTFLYLRFRRWGEWVTPVTWSRFGIYLAISIFTGYIEYGQNGLLENILKLRYKPLYALEQIGPLGYHLADSVNYVREHSASTLSGQQIADIQCWFKQNEQLNFTTGMNNEYKGRFKGKNVIFIHFESLENFPLNKHWNNVELTPNLNKILKHSVYFSNIKEQVGEGNSADAEFIVFNSLYSLPQGIVSLRYPTDHYFSWPRELREYGYETAAFVGMEKAFMNMGVMLPGYGFHRIFPITSFKFKEKIGLGLPDKEMFPQALDKIRQLPKPFFAYLITLTNHVPYYIPHSLQNADLSKGNLHPRIRGYLQTLHYADHALGQFVRQLKETGLEKDTLLVIYGDHEGINKYYTKDVAESGLNWVKNNKTVPLIIYQPSLRQQEIKILGGQVDILPTIEYLMDLPSDPRKQYRVGRNLLTSKEGFAILHNGDYLSEKETSPTVKNHRLQGLDMSHKVLQADLFSKKLIIK